jgi:hypothetical protein
MNLGIVQKYLHGGAYLERTGAFSFVPRVPGVVFSDHLSTGEFCPLRIPLDKLGAAASPIDKW